MPDPTPDIRRVFDQLFGKRPHLNAPSGRALFAPTTSASAPQRAASSDPSTTNGQAGPWWARVLTHVQSRLRGTRSRAVVGIDVGASAIKAVRVERVSGTPTVTGVACEEFPTPIEAEAQERFLQERLQVLARDGLLSGQWVVGFPDARTGVELVTLPKMPAVDVRGAVSFEARERLGADPAMYSVRHVVVGESQAEGQAQQDILIIAARRDEILAQWKKFAEKGFRVIAIEPTMLAAAAACEAAGLWRPESFSGILEIGRRNSTLALVLQGGIRFVRTFPVAGDSTTQSIMDYCQYDFAMAEVKKREIGLSQMALEEDRRQTGLEAEPRVKVSHALGLYLERLAAEVEHSLRYFIFELNQTKERPLDGLYLLGGGALLKNLAPFLASRLHISVTVADPFAAIAMSASLRERLRTQALSARLADALGFALHPLARATT